MNARLFHLPIPRSLGLLLLCCLGLNPAGWAQQVETLTAKPLSQAIKTPLRPVPEYRSVQLPVVTRGGDLVPILAETEGLFARQNAQVTLVREDDFRKQVEASLSGRTPYVRGTLGMITAAAEAFQAQGGDLVVIYQLTWSAGGDALVVRADYDLKEIKTLAAPLYGPAMDYLPHLWQDKALKSTKIRWVAEPTLPGYATPGKVVDPASVFQADPTLDAALCLLPDALMLTSNGTIGTGAEGSVKGATLLQSTQADAKVIADVYAVRKDYLEQHPQEVARLVQALMEAETRLEALAKTPTDPAYRRLLTTTAQHLFGTAHATAETEELWNGYQFVGREENQTFFTGQDSLISPFQQHVVALQPGLQGLGVVAKPVTLQAAPWEYTRDGVRYAVPVVATPAADTVARQDSAVAPATATVQAPTPNTAAAPPGELEIYFAPNERTSDKTYTDDFRQVLAMTRAFRNPVVKIEGHADPQGILKAKAEGASEQQLNTLKQRAKNLSYVRAEQIRAQLLDYAQTQNLPLDQERVVAIGEGVQHPKYESPKNEAQWQANRRVVFRVEEAAVQ
ncbi:OmpA family protein [Catalinimonas alkaloidigena]|uniref:OmpA family protein n=1 Tax=Catalinimonas alkaloidigena TaxID=1075417 RepID=A0A1G9EAU7_9BACT|nr:OmpA family protein [Catalinimonas alkaloidigena]SDK73302.1 OmpA family protein [Catalinimonas alkaloidigena]